MICPGSKDSLSFRKSDHYDQVIKFIIFEITVGIKVIVVVVNVHYVDKQVANKPNKTYSLGSFIRTYS